MSSIEGIISWAANIASIVSLAVSIYVAWQVRGIKGRFVRRFAVAAFLRQLREHNVVLTELIEEPLSDKMRTIGELARCEANLRSALPHLDEPATQDAREALRLLGVRPPDMAAIYVLMIRLLQSLENAAAEQEAKSNVE